MYVKRLQVFTRSPEETRQIGKALGARAQPGHVFLLIGPLGVGKTCFAQGVLWGLGVDEYARSPTFVLVSQYPGRIPMYHIDLYRLDTTAQLLDLGLDEYLYGDGVCVVEWADKVRDAFPLEHLEVRMEHVDETTRRLTITTNGSGYDAVLEAAERAVTRGK